MKIIKYLFIGLVITICGSYLIPAPSKSFSELYEGNNKSLVDSLENFRKIPTQTLDYKDHKWQYLITGKGEKTLLFLHGMAGNYDFWWQQIEQFKGNYKVVSVTYPPVSTLAEMSEAVIKILDKNNIQQVTVVGSSLGGYFSQYLVNFYPNRIEKAVFGNTFPPNDILKEKNSTTAFIGKLLPEWLLLNMLRGNLYKGVIPAAQNDPLAKAILLENTYGRMSKAQFLARYDCVVDKFTVNSNASKIPVLIIESDNDPLISPELRAMLKATYPTAKVHTFHAQGHFPYINATAEYNETLKGFLEAN